ncbi:hypothetical protein MY4824_003425 [Beauveria thailandica]
MELNLAKSCARDHGLVEDDVEKQMGFRAI